MSLEEAAKRGKLRKQQAQDAAMEERRERDDARVVLERKRLDRVYGLNADLGAFGVYMMAMSALLVGVLYATQRVTPNPKHSVSTLLAAPGLIFVLGLLAWIAGKRVPAQREEHERWIRERKYPFDAEGYKRSLRDHDSMRGWLRIAVRFARAVEPDVRLKMEDAAIGLGAARATWIDDRTLYVASAEVDTSVRTKNASFNTARPLHTWFRGFAETGLPTLLDGRGVEKVTAYVGKWTNGSWDCAEDDA